MAVDPILLGAVAGVAFGVAIGLGGVLWSARAGHLGEEAKYVLFEGEAGGEGEEDGGGR